MEFKITRGQGKCSVTGRSFADGEKYIIALNADPSQEGLFQRVEMCSEAWERQPSGAFIAWWPAEHSTNKKPALLDPDLLWEVFHRARAEQPDTRFTPAELERFAYVAALGLMRLKKLKLKQTRRQGKREFLVFEVPGKTKDRQVFDVADPGLDEHGVTQVEERIAEFV